MSEISGKTVGQAPRAHELDPIEIASRDAISALQLRRLRWSLNRVYENVPHYRRAFDDAGAHPDDLRDLSDIRPFPFTAQADLPPNSPFASFALPREQGFP